VHASVITAGSAESSAAIGALLVQLRATLGAAEKVPVSSYEELGDAALPPLLGEARAVVNAALENASQLLSLYDAVADRRAALPEPDREESPDSAELCGLVERAMSEDVGIQRIQNLAFIARMGLRARLSLLDALGPAPSKWELIAACSSALREVMKALGALALAICAQEGLAEPATFYVTEVERSLAVRRAYRIFHADIAPAHEPHGAEIKPRLRRAANAIAKLVGRPIYASMRVHDRFGLRSMQRRLRAWLAATTGTTAHDAAGLRLFQDLAHLTELMMSVNDRAELRAHDARVAESQLAALEQGAASVAAALSALRVMEGRDAWLDAAMGAASPPEKAELVAHLERLVLGLTPQRPSVSGPRRAPVELPDGDEYI
jgi:hypothetical protein